MRKPVLLSAAAHVVIVSLALVAFPSPEELPSVQTRALPVELVTVDQVTNLMSTKKVEKPKPVEKPEPPRPEEPEKSTSEPKPEPKPAPPPPPEEKAEIIPEKKVEKKEEKPKPVEKKVEKKPTPPKQKPEKKSFDPNQIAALLDKTPDTVRKSEALESTQDFESPVTDDPSAAMTMSEIDAVRQKVQRCWNIRDFAGSADADKLAATISFSLNQNGSLAGFPSIAKTSGGPLSRLFAERAIQAVQKCAPYDFLPPDKFTSWRDMRLSFTLAEMM
jgi:outer membrane biosynthesis protein TonB